MSIKDQAPVGITCPTIDSIIEMLEEVRRANDTLRCWGNDLCAELEDAKDEYREMEKEYEKKIGLLEDRIAELEEEVASHE